MKIPKNMFLRRLSSKPPTWVLFEASTKSLGSFFSTNPRMTAKRPQPSWSPPETQDGVHLKLYNSLTCEKEKFAPQNGNNVTWYNCGPTVYDASHMGHARNYLTFDILRRVIQNYFQYNVYFVMNITDIDDKIIKRARQNYLYQNYIDNNPPLDEILKNCHDVLKTQVEKVKTTFNLEQRSMQEHQIGLLKEAITKAESVINSGDNDDEVREHLLLAGKDLLSDWLDRKFGSDVTENSIFAKLPKFWEERFLKDMEALNILPADRLTRVSDFIPQINEFIQKVIDHGYAYESNGSVYFDVAKFDSSPNHHYAKLVPSAVGDLNTLLEGEGDLSVSKEQLQERRSSNDFALWKRSKPGEPSWDSPWGKGRPGWHVECSAMASEVFGESLDIHTGGSDLKFPHHDNELAQSEAYHGNNHWVRYFLHSGHLTIAGCKMSKSLKNYITIQEVLERYTARQLRLNFLLHSWRDTLDYSDDTMELARSYEKSVKEYLLEVKDALRSEQSYKAESSKEDEELNKKFHKCVTDVHTAMCDSINTRLVLEAIRILISEGNKYLRLAGGVDKGILKNTADYITRIFDVFGLEDFGFSKDERTSVEAYLVLAKFRDDVRKHGIVSKNADLLALCDALRDDILPYYGVRLEDKGKERPAVIKLVDKDELLRERELKKQLEEAKKLEKEKKKVREEAKKSALETQRRIPPSQMFINETDKYSKFDEKGIPTHNVRGEKLSQGLLKKIHRRYQAQEKNYNDFLNSVKEQ